MKILVVDDSSLSRKLLIRNIPDAIRADSQILHGANGQEAVDLYRTHRPDIVFLDLTMPVMNGYEALDQIMAFDPSARVCVITADIQKKAEEKVLASGARALERKPIDETRLTQLFTAIAPELE